MEHTDAILSNAVERYLLDEMTEDEQEIFERHYFDCRVCSADVTDGTRMMMAGRLVAAKDEQPSNVVALPVARFAWLQAAAAASLIFGLLGGEAGYLIAVRQHEHRTELVRVVQIDTGVSRAGTHVDVQTLHAGDDLRFDVAPDEDAVRYVAVVTCGGTVQSKHGISREMAADAVSLRLGELPAGPCDLVIEGVRKDGNPFQITRSRFKVEVGER